MEKKGPNLLQLQDGNLGLMGVVDKSEATALRKLRHPQRLGTL